MKIKEKYYESVGEQVYFTRLSNGLTIHLIPKEDYYETYGIITTKFGSVDTRILVNGDERQYPAGIAHFLEHKVFEDENGQDYLKKFVHLGSESNAFTSFTKTSYLFSTTSKVPENIQLLLEMVSKASFTEKSVSKEREIIQQEIGMYQDSPDYRLFFGALEKALIEFRTDKRKKTVIVHAQPEALVGTGPVVTPVSTMLEHILMSRVNDMSEGRLETGLLTVSGESIDYEGVNLKGRHVVIICDIHDNESPYLAECIKLCKEMKASHVVAVPLMLWNPDLIDNLTEESIKAELSHENRPLS